MKGIVDYLNPLGLTWLGLTWLALVCWRRRREKPPGSPLVYTLWVVLTATCWTPLPERLLANLERPWAQPKWDQLPKADALVVLGGGAGTTSGELMGLDMSNASDRLITGIELMRRGLAPELVMGGSIRESTDARPSEGVLSERLIRNWRLLDGPIHQLGRCANTYEEALSMSKLVKTKGWKSVLLVTSASHMRRSVATFEKQGINVIPVPCAFRSKVNQIEASPWWPTRPDAGKIELVSIWLYETIGYAAYRARGWL
jgi:uncharacterized SAM-binding protein YcdF (DUF218 family)